VSNPSSSLALSVGDPVTVQAGDTLLIEVVVVGADGRGVTLSAPDLPSFVTLTGSQFRLAPDRSVAPGEYDVTVVATAGSETASATLSITVKRFNTAPVLGMIDFFEDGHEKCACDYSFELNANDCRFASDPVLTGGASDDENDDVVFDFEFRDAGEPLSGIPDYSIRAPPNHQPTAFQQTVTLAPGGIYTMAFRVCDVLGACITADSFSASGAFFHRATDLDAGWILLGTIGRSPAPSSCTPGVLGSACSANGDCCSGVCDLTTTSTCGAGGIRCDCGTCR
jgi:hypothetical protein